MITTLRKSFKTKLYKAILWIVILATGGVFSAFEMVRLFFGGGTSSRWVIKINGYAVDQSVLRRKTINEQERIRMIRAQYGQYADLILQMMHASSDPEAAAIDAIIREALLNQVAQGLALSVGPDFVSEKLSDLAFIQRELSDVIPMQVLEAPGVINMRALRMYLQRSGISGEEFDTLVMQAIKRYMLEQLVSSADYTPLFELKRQFYKDYVSKKYSVKKISAQTILNKLRQKPVTDSVLQEFYDSQNAQTKRYVVREQRSGTLWTFSPAGFNITISDAAVEEYYQKNKAREFVQSPAQVQVRHIFFKVDEPVHASAVREKAEKVRAELLKDPSLFAQKARELSDDKTSAAQGGQLAYFAKGEREEAFERAAFTLKEDNAISALISTTQGFEIIQRTGKKAIAYKPVSAVKETIVKKLTATEFGKRFSAQTRVLLADQNLSKAKIEAFVAEKHAKKTDINDQINSGSVMAKTLFRLKKGETGEYQDDSNGMLITLSAIKESYTPTLASLKEDVKDDYYFDLANTELAKQVEQAVAEARKAPLAGEGVESLGWLKKDDATRIAELDKQGITTARLFQLENVGAATSSIGNGIGYVMRLDEIGSFDEGLFAKEQSKIKAELLKQRPTFLLAGFVASLWRSATIVKNESLLHLES